MQLSKISVVVRSKKKEMKQPLPFTVLLLIFIHFINSYAQAPAPAQASAPAQVSAPVQASAPAPGPPGPTNVTKILEKAGHFTTFIRLLKATKIDDRMKTQLNDSNQGLTIFAPPDDAFSSLKSGMLNSLTDEQKAELIEFHTIPTFFSLSQFQTASNPMRTEAGGSDWQFPLNVTTSANSVNFTTGIVNASVASALYTDGQLAIYQVDRVLLPQMFFVSPPPAPAPAPSKHKKNASSSETSDNIPADSSNATRLARKLLSARTCIFSVLATFTFYL